MDDDLGVIRRRTTAVALVAAFLVLLVLSARSAMAAGTGIRQDTTATTSGLPRTALEAEARDDGTNSGAPWMLGSAAAAAVVVLVGGTVLKRRADRAA